MRAFLSIAKVTFEEFSRQKIVFVMLFVAIFLTLVTLLLSSLSLNERLRISIHIGFGSIQFLQVFLALFLGSNLLSKELERQTLFILLARPISRKLLFWSKWFGLVILLAHFQLVLGIVHSLLIFEGVDWMRFFWAQLQLFIEAICILSISMSLSVFLRPPLVIATTFSLWLGGYWQNEFIYFAERSQSEFFTLLSSFSNYIFPNFIIGSELRSVYFLSSDMVSKWGGLSVLQIILYSLIFLFLGEYLFNKKDLA